MTDANLVVERRTIAVGDRIEYRIYNRKHGIASHEFATVMKWDGKEATLKFDGGRILKGSLSPHIDLGYCSTVHSAQGGTIDRVIVNLDSMRAGRLINRQAFYVRFAKRQQMQWTPRGAHLLLQTRTRALDGTLRLLFERWHPGLATNHANVEVERAAA